MFYTPRDVTCLDLMVKCEIDFRKPHTRLLSIDELQYRQYGSSIKPGHSRGWLILPAIGTSQYSLQSGIRHRVVMKYSYLPNKNIYNFMLVKLIKNCYIIVD